jgi:hypothetical protein
MSDIQGLLNELRLVFGDVRRADGVTLHEAHVIDAYGNSDERAKARALDTDEYWWQVPDEDISDGWGYCALTFMDPAGLHYYLPAYLSWMVRVGETTTSASYEHTVYTLGSLGSRSEQFVHFTAAQSETVLRCTEYFMTRDPDICMAEFYQAALIAWRGRVLQLEVPL